MLLVVSGADRPGDWAARFGDAVDSPTLVYARHGDQRLELASDGSLLVREDGGPRRDRGQLLNFASSTVRAWKVRVPAERHAALVAGLRAALTAKVSDADGGSQRVGGLPAPSLAMDEVPSSLYVHHLDGQKIGMEVTSNLLELSAPLLAICTELDALCLALVACRETHSLPNPELDEWPEEARRSLPQPSRWQRGVAWARDALGVTEAPREDSGARAAAQAAIDAYYDGPSFAALGQLRPVRHPGADFEPVSFIALCSRTGAQAGALDLRPEGSSGWLSLTSFLPTGNVGRRVEGPQLAAAREALAVGDLRALFRIDPEIVPFYCPACDAPFAASQWRLEQRSASSVAGTCPSGHRRSLCAD